MYFYILDCINNCPNLNENYTHIKARIDGSQIVICAQQEIIADNITEKTQEEVQTIIDNWITTENETTYTNIDEIEIIQENINLNKFLRIN